MKNLILNNKESHLWKENFNFDESVLLLFFVTRTIQKRKVFKFSSKKKIKEKPLESLFFEKITNGWLGK